MNRHQWLMHVSRMAHASMQSFHHSPSMDPYCQFVGLVRNLLRMRPDRIVIGEVRGGEAIDMLQAMNTGHDGSLTTIHANTPRDALARIETMIQMTGMRLSDRAMRQQIASALDLVLQAARHSDGSRRVTSIAEITGMEGDTITMQEIF